MLKIESVKVEAILDDDPDTSFLGEFTDTPEPWAVCRHCGRYVYDAERYDRVVGLIDERMYDLGEEQLNCTDESAYPRMDKAYNALQMAADKLNSRLHDCSQYTREYNYFKPYAGGEKEGTPNYKIYGLRDHARMEKLVQGDWHFIGIRAKAVVSHSNGGNCKRLETLHSDELWGIESDAGDYHKEVAQEELDGLKDHLAHFNVDLSNWDELIESVKLTY
jgi:hypothetical protein